ncbi:CAH6-like protein [Mya arenaria]|uniref:carbonic anhydrase n=1 Tax=Mya arenaria TaxID=6604 RepID=A0ABY7E334_MYAAR|nr:CAH6-like protein [Mya arenaria]
MTEVDLNMFFNRQCQFYTYAGSTTTPPCHQSVRWIIMKDPLMVTERAWFRLTGLQSRGDFNSRFGNYRTTQPLNDRMVEANFMPENGPVRPSPDAEIIAMMARPNMLVLPSPDAPRSAMMAARMTDVNPGNVTADAAGVSSMATMAGGGAAPPMAMGGILRSSMPIPPGSPMSAMMMMMTPALNANVGRIIQDFMMRPRGSRGTGPGVMSSGQGMSGMMSPMEAMGSGMPPMMLRTIG